MKTLKNYSSYRTINGILSSINFVCLKHSSININGVKHGCSGFWKNNDTNKIIYINTDMLPATYGNVLIRGAKDDNDYKGFINNYAKTAEGLADLAIKLTK